jgi:hypothetical protein
VREASYLVLRLAPDHRNFGKRLTWQAVEKLFSTAW